MDNKTQNCTKNEVRLALDTYIDNNNKMAFFMYGDWGVGKTYFIKNYIENFNNTSEMLFIYVSVNGVSSIDNLKELVVKKFLAASLSMAKDKIVAKTAWEKAYNTYLNIDRYGINIKSIGSLMGAKKFETLSTIIEKSTEEFMHSKLNQNITFIIDDLERMKVSLQEELFGYIATDLLDNSDAKVILIGNEHILLENESNYESIREKIIDKSIEFKLSTDNVITELVRKTDITSSDEAFDDLIKNVLSIYTFNQNKQPNLRHVISALGTIKTYYNGIKELDVSVSDKELALKAIMILTHLHREGILNINNADKCPEKITNIDSQLEKISEDSKEKELLTDLKRLGNLFEVDDDDSLYEKTIISLVLSNSFNVDKYKNKHNFVENDQYNQEDKRPVKFSSIDFTPRNISQFKNDEELKAAENELINIDENSFKLKEYVRTLNIITGLKSKGLWLLEDNGSFENKIFNAISEYVPTDKDFSESDLRWGVSLHDRKLERVIQEKISSVLASKCIDACNQLLKNADDKLLVTISSFQNVSIFKSLTEIVDESTTLFEIKNLNNYFKNQVRSFIDQNVEINITEIEYIGLLQEKLSKLAQSDNNNKLKCFYLEDTCETLDRIKRRIRSKRRDNLLENR